MQTFLPGKGFYNSTADIYESEIWISVNIDKPDETSKSDVSVKLRKRNERNTTCIFLLQTIFEINQYFINNDKGHLLQVEGKHHSFPHKELILK